MYNIRLAAFPVILAFILCGCSGANSVNYFAPSGALGEATGSPLQTLDGEITSLAKQRGSLFLIHFWATWCAVCQHELPSLEKLANKFVDRGLSIILIALDKDVTAVRKCINAHKITLPTLVDVAGDFSSKISLSAIPVTMLIDKNGALIPFPDPANGELIYRTEGPRNWNNKHFVRYLLSRAESEAL